MSDDLILSPEVEARAALAGRKLTLRMLLPPYPALGCGRLRVIRLRDIGDATELLCTYEGYERLGAA
jgi:hypothetical protein